LAERRRNAQSLLGFGDEAIAPQAKSFIQIDAEHGIRCFKPVKNLQISMGLSRRAGISNLETLIRCAARKGGTAQETSVERDFRLYQKY